MGLGIHVSGSREASRHIKQEEVYSTSVISISTEVAVAMSIMARTQAILLWLANSKQDPKKCAYCDKEMSTSRIENRSLLCADCQGIFEDGKCLRCKNKLPIKKIVDFHSFFCDPCQDARRQQQPP